MNILDYINKINEIYGKQEPRNMAHGGRIGYEDGQLVRNTVDGSRPGYGGPGSGSLQRASKTGYIVVFGDPKAGNHINQYFGKQEYGSLAKAKEAAKNFQLKTAKTFKPLPSNIGSPAQTKAILKEQKKIAKQTSSFKNSINDWTKNWIKENINNYNIKQSNKFINDLKKAWAKESKNKKYQISGVDTGMKGRVLTQNGFPAVSTKRAVNTFNVFGYEMPGGTKTDMIANSQRNLYSKIFYTNILKNNPDLNKKLNFYFDYITADKRGTNASSLSQKVTDIMKKANVTDVKDLLNKDVMYLLSSDSGMGDKARYEFFKNNFGKKYSDYRHKVDVMHGDYVKNVRILKDKFGINVKSQLNKENNALRKIFDVKDLPKEMRYSGDHLFGVAQAAKSNNKKFAMEAINNLVGMTREQNKILGLGEFERTRKSLINQINTAKVGNKTKLLTELNSLMANTYQDFFGKKQSYYALDKGKVAISKNFVPLNQGERFAHFFKKINKTKEGAAAIKAQHGSLNNLLKKVKNVKGPGRLKALQYLVSLGGAGFAASIGFSPTEVQAAEAEAGETGAVAEKSISSLLFDSGLSAKDRAKIFGTGVIGDVLVNKSKLSKAFFKGLPFLWTPGGEVAGALIHKLTSGKEPALEDFAEGLKAGGYDINSEEFKEAWNTIPEEDRKEMLYDWSGKVIDKRSTGEKIKETAAAPLTHVSYAFWKHGVESMQKLLAANPGSSALKNKLKQAALFGIRAGIPMKVISALNPIGWTLTGATAYSAIQQEFEGKMRKTPLTEPEQMDIQKRKTAVPTILNVFDQASQMAKEQGISYEEALKQVKTDKPLDIPGLDFKIDYSLPKNFAGGGPVRLTTTVVPDSEGIMNLKKKKW